MYKQNTIVNVNIPADYLMEPNMNNMFIVADCTVINTADCWNVIIEEMTFKRTTAFAIKPECISKVIDLIEMIAIEDVYRQMDELENYDHEMYYHELAI